MTDLKAALADLGFPNTDYDVSVHHDLGDLIQDEERCGIYVLQFANGELYVGLSVNVIKRYSQHQNNYNDIKKLNFKCVPPDRLKREEKEVIQSLEKAGFHLRNVVHTSVSYAPSSFDEIMSPENQIRWLQDLAYIDSEGERPQNPDLRQKYTRHYKRFTLLPFAEEILSVLHEYVHLCIPAYLGSEMYYWCCSCLPKQEKGVTIYSRINIYWQEVFTVGVEQGRIFFSWHSALSPLRVLVQGTRHRYKLFIPAIFKHPIQLLDHKYKPGGQDQVQIYAETSVENALTIIRDPIICSAIRLFNLRLMQKGPNVYYKNHCFDLADRLIC